MSGDTDTHPRMGLRAALLAGGAIRHKARLATAADAVIVLALVGAAVCVPLLSINIVRLRDRQTQDAESFRGLERTVERHIAVSHLEGSPLPERLTSVLRPSLVSRAHNHKARVLLVAYTHTVCQRCLHDGLESLRKARATIEPSTAVHALVGERTARERERALLLRQDGLLSFPITFIPSNDLLAALYGHLQGEFADEPIYLLLDRELTVRSAFQADQRRPNLLDQWLQAIR